MRFVKKTLKLQFSVFSFGLLFIAFSAFGNFIYYSLKAEMVSRNEKQISNQLQDYINLFDLIDIEKNIKVKNSLKIADYIFNKANLEEIKDEKISFNAIKQNTKDTINVQLNKWLINGKQLQNNYEMVDLIKSFGSQTSTIFQKIDYGYLRISTNVMNSNNQRAVGSFIPNNSEIIKTIEKGETYYGRIFVVSDWYETAYKPIYIDGKIKGILYVGEQEKKLDIFKNKFYSKKIFETGYPFIISNNEVDKGLMILNPLYENENWHNIDNDEKRNIYNKIQNKFNQCKQDKNLIESNNCEFKFTSNLNDETYYVFSRYYSNYNYFISIIVSEYDYILKPLHYLGLWIFGISAFFIIISTILTMRFIKIITKPFEKIIFSLKQMAEGNLSERIEVKCNEDIAEISHSINSLSKILAKSAEFANAIGKRDFNFKYKLNSENDILGNALLKMRNDLLSYSKERMQNGWIQNSSLKISNVLQGEKKSDILGNELLASFAEILNIQVACLYLSSDKDELILTSTYAVEKEQFNKKVFSFGEGLVGQSAFENKTIIFDSVPENYLHIESGIGKIAVNYVIIIPFIFRNKVIGLIEIGTTKKLSELKIQFLNNISENIAVAFNTINSNNKTKELLAQTIEQSEELKTQQEELKAINESLEEQSQRLEESYEELEILNETMSTQKNKLQHEAEKLSIITDSVPAMLAYISADMKFIYANQKYANFFNKSKSEIIGLHIRDLVEEFDTNKFIDIRKKIISGKIVTIEHVKIIKGEKINLFITYVPQIDKNTKKIKAFLIMILDITERVTAEKKIKQANEELSTQNEKILQQRDSLQKLNLELGKNQVIIESKNKSITNSINYAKRIQKAVLTPHMKIDIEKLFIFLKPRDIVSGDFFYVKEENDLFYIAAVDCTGHGVPGAFMSMLGISFLNEIIANGITNTNEILDQLREKIKQSLGQTGSYNEAKDGMDMSLCIIDNQNYKVQYSGAYSPLYLVKNKQLIETKATRNPIGIHLKEKPFEKHEFTVTKGDTIYLFSDGFVDQIGGNDGSKFKPRAFRKLILNISDKPITNQKMILEETLNEWQGDKYEQIDDILIMGYKI